MDVNVMELDNGEITTTTVVTLDMIQEAEIADYAKMTILIEEEDMTATKHFMATGNYLSETLRECFESRRALDGQACDVRLYSAGGDRFARAHRAVLAAVSPMLKTIFAEVDPYQNRELDVSLPDIKYPDLQALLEFMYLGRLDMIHKRRGRTLQKWMEVLGMKVVVDEVDVGNDAAADEGQNQDEAAKEEGKTDEGGEQTELDATTVVRDLVESEKTIVVGDQIPDRTVHCADCNKDFQSFLSYKIHRSTVHVGEKKFQCNECGRKFRHQETLVSHARQHSDEKYKCEDCDKEYKFRKELLDHMNVHSGEKLYLCDTCPAKFPTKKQFYNHKESHRTEVDPCHICGKKLKNVACYKAHMKNHGKAAQHACDIPGCLKAFKRGFDLKVHMRIHSGAKPYVCGVCNKSFSLSSAYAKHRRFHTESSNVYPCNLCGDNFPTTADLNMHVKSHDSVVETSENSYILVGGATSDGGDIVADDADTMTVVGMEHDGDQMSLSLPNSVYAEQQQTIIITENSAVKRE